MLTNFSWHQYFLAVGSLLLVYYPAILVLCYRHEWRSLLARAFPMLRPSGLKDAACDRDVLGAAAPDAVTLPVDAAEIRVAPPSFATHSTPETDDQPDFQVETITDLLQELRPLLELTLENPVDKDAFCSLVRLIVSRYRDAIPDRLRDQVHRFLLDKAKDRLPYELTSADLQSLWTGPSDSQ
jgi:hypothetical protein